MSNISHNPTNFNSGYDRNARLYDQRMAIDFSRGGINARPGCQIDSEFDTDTSSSERSYAPQDLSLPEDTYVPEEQGFVPYSCKDLKRKWAEQNSEAQPAVKPTPVARPNAVTKAGGKPHAGARVRPLQQSNSSSCGQTSVAMSVNCLTGRKLTDKDINSKHGFGLLSALNKESRGSGYKWSDNGNFSNKSWPGIERRLNQEKTPILIGLNGQFSASGRGHIVTLMSIDGNKVTYADPADGKVKTTTKQAIESAPGHPDGKFMFVASKA